MEEKRRNKVKKSGQGGKREKMKRENSGRKDKRRKESNRKGDNRISRGRKNKNNTCQEKCIIQINSRWSEWE